MRCAIKSFAGHEKGAIAVEFAILLPLMLLIMLGSFEVTRLVRASIRLTNTAQTVADLVAQQDDLSSAEMADICVGGKMVMTPFSGSSLVANVASVTYSGTSRTVDWQDATCGSGAAIGTATTLAAPYTPNAKDSVVIVQALYTYTPLFVTVLSGNFTMTRYAYARPRNGTTVTHS